MKHLILATILAAALPVAASAATFGGIGGGHGGKHGPSAFVMPSWKPNSFGNVGSWHDDRDDNKKGHGSYKVSSADWKKPSKHDWDDGKGKGKGNNWFGQLGHGKHPWSREDCDPTPPPSPVPLPAGFGLLAVGMGVLGITGRRRKSA